MILVVLPLLPLAAALVTLVPAKPTLARVATLVAALLALAIALRTAQGVGISGAWMPLPNWVGADALSTLLLLLQAVLAGTAALYSWGYIAREAGGDERRERRYYLDLNLFVTSLFLVPKPTSTSTNASRRTFGDILAAPATSDAQVSGAAGDTPCRP